MIRLLFKSLAVSLLAWFILSWPLPHYLATGIPAGVQPQSPNHIVHRMIPGDHLQLMYHFGLVHEMIAGRIPLFYNLYEFNTGVDAQRYEPNSYYVPFALIFSLGQALANAEIGWNLASFISLWLTTFFTWLLLRRYSGSEALCASFSMLAMILPYRWHALMGGSPTGFTMMWVPLVLLGLDLAVRDGRWRGGVVAGLGLMLCSWGDPQTFFFCGLLTPIWCALAFLMREGSRWRDLWPLALRLLPVLALALVGLQSSKGMTRHIEGSATSKLRDITEVALFSPQPKGLFSLEDLGITNQIYLGYVLPAILALGFAGLVWALFRAGRARARPLVFLALSCGVILLAVVLSMGPFGPFEGRAFTAARKYVPHYGLIRQPAKIFAVLPPLFAVAGILGWSALAGPSRLRRAILAGAAGAALLWDYSREFEPMICLVDDQQAAYAAAASDAPAPDQPPRALVLPLWPGDAHYSSIYQHYALMHHLRMVNGYRPFVSRDYISNTYQRFQTANMGLLDDAQYTALRAQGVSHILLHEDPFPEMVSPFPVSFTLQNLLRDPRLELVTRAHEVWAFRLRSTPAEAPPAPPACSIILSARTFEAEKLARAEKSDVSDPACNGGGFLQMTRPGIFGLLRPVQMPGLPGLRWMARARGPGAFSFRTMSGDTHLETTLVQIESTNWVWKAVPLPAISGVLPLDMDIRWVSGRVDLDTVMLTAADWPELAPGRSITLPAACLFHAGYSDPTDQSVHLSTTRDRTGLVIYGPKLPVEPGSYRIAMESAPIEKDPVQTGRMVVACPEGREIARVDVYAGTPAVLDCEIPANVPLVIAIDYYRKTDLTIRDITITRR